MKDRIKKIRRQMKWTQADLASRIGVTRDVVASWENGKVDPPETAIRLICREYAFSYDWLKYGLEPMNVPLDALTVDKLARIMKGDNEFLKAVFRELADLPNEAWAEVAALVDRLYAANHRQGRSDA